MISPGHRCRGNCAFGASRLFFSRVAGPPVASSSSVATTTGHSHHQVSQLAATSRGGNEFGSRPQGQMGSRVNSQTKTNVCVSCKTKLTASELASLNSQPCSEGATDVEFKVQI